MIRRSNNKDTDKIADLWLDTNIKAHDFIEEDYWHENFETVKGMLSAAEIYVYEYENDIKGFVGLEKGYIQGIFVNSTEQSKGIGKELMDFLKGFNRQLMLHVYQRNLKAVDFYKREGFDINEESTDINTGEKEYLMVWEDES